VKWWRRWRRARDTSGEAQAQLARLEGQDAEIAELGEELRETQRRNHFSGMVAAAITRAAQEGR
jgi:hypothetical protein